MATTARRTIREIITRAARLGGLTDVEEFPTPKEYQIGIEALDDMLKAWQNTPYKIWTKTEGVLPLVADTTSYVLDPARPLHILSARYWTGSQDREMYSLTRDEYFNLPNKTQTGNPHSYYYDRQVETGTLYIWQPLVSVDGDEIRYTYSRELEDIESLDDNLDTPGETWEGIKYQLAIRMCHNLNSPVPPDVKTHADRNTYMADRFDTEESVFFIDEVGYYDGLGT